MDINVNDLLGLDFDDYLHSQVSEYAEPRSAAKKSLPVHTIADAAVPTLRKAFLASVPSGTITEASITLWESRLREALIPVLQRVVVLSARAHGMVFKTLGDLPGHEFHGNQWTDGGTPQDGASISAKDAADRWVTPGGQKEIKQAERDGVETPLASGWHKALDESPDAAVGTYHRGIGGLTDDQLNEMIDSKTITFDASSSFSKSAKEAQVFADKQTHGNDAFVMITLKSDAPTSGLKDISHLNRYGEKEIIGRKGLTIQVLDSEEMQIGDKMGYRITARVMSLKGAESLRTLKPPQKSTLTGMKFDVHNPKAAAWARTQAAKLAKDITRETLETVRDLIATGISEGRTIRTTAKLLRDVIGLTSRQGESLIKLREKLDEEGVTGKDQDDEVEARYDELLKRRADVIAHNETMLASNTGQQILWDEALDEGLLTGNEMKEWLITPDDRLCPICAAMENVQVGMDEEFDVDGEMVSTPPGHVGCRCTMGLVLPKITAAASPAESTLAHVMRLMKSVLKGTK